MDDIRITILKHLAGQHDQKTHNPHDPVYAQGKFNPDTFTVDKTTSTYDYSPSSPKFTQVFAPASVSGVVEFTGTSAVQSKMFAALKNLQEYRSKTAIVDKKQIKELNKAVNTAKMNLTTFAKDKKRQAAWLAANPGKTLPDVNDLENLPKELIGPREHYALIQDKINTSVDGTAINELYEFGKEKPTALGQTWKNDVFSPFKYSPPPFTHSTRVTSMNAYNAMSVMQNEVNRSAASGEPLRDEYFKARAFAEFNVHQMEKAAVYANKFSKPGDAPKPVEPGKFSIALSAVHYRGIMDKLTNLDNLGMDVNGNQSKPAKLMWVVNEWGSEQLQIPGFEGGEIQSVPQGMKVSFQDGNDDPTAIPKTESKPIETPVTPANPKAYKPKESPASPKIKNKGFATPIVPTKITDDEVFERKNQQPKLDNLSGATQLYEEVYSKMQKIPGFKNYVNVMKSKYSSNDQSRAISDQLVNEWAGTSMNSVVSASIQSAISEVFDIPMNANAASNYQIKAVNEKEGVYTKFKDVFTEFVRIQYEHTQKTLKERGISEVWLFRGTSAQDGVDKDLKPGLYQSQLELNPASSFSYGMTEAINSFGYGKFMIAAKVPIERILSFGSIGMGCSSEHEAIVLGGDTKSWFVVSPKQTLGSAGSYYNGITHDGGEYFNSLKNLIDLWYTDKGKMKKDQNLVHMTPLTLSPDKTRGGADWLIDAAKKKGLKGKVSSSMKKGGPPSNGGPGSGNYDHKHTGNSQDESPKEDWSGVNFKSPSYGDLHKFIQSYAKPMEDLGNKFRELFPGTTIRTRLKDAGSAVYNMNRQHKALNQLDDLGGIRLTVNGGMKDLQKAYDELKSKFGSKIKEENIFAIPDLKGAHRYAPSTEHDYRGAHIYIEQEPGKIIEVQLQTKRQTTFASFTHRMLDREYTPTALKQWIPAMSKHYYRLDMGLPSTAPVKTPEIQKAYDNLIQTQRTDYGYGKERYLPDN